MEVSYIGERDSRNAYGLSIWHSNTLIENCIFSDCGRRAVSYNLYLNRPPKYRILLNNLIVRNNVFKRGYHTTSIDVSCMYSTSDTIKNIYFYNNIIDDSDIKSTKWGTSNQVFIQNGKERAVIDSVFIVGNLFIEATARNIQFMNGDHYFVWNNTIYGHNPNISKSPWGNVDCRNARFVDFRNNILLDNMTNPKFENNSIHGYNSHTDFLFRDYNLYWQESPGKNRNFTSIYRNGSNKYYSINDWNKYRADFPEYDLHSPEPADPLFQNPKKNNFALQNNSPAKNAGIKTPIIIIMDPFGKKDSLNIYDLNGLKRDSKSPSIGAFE